MGVLEYWSAGDRNPILHHSITPTLQARVSMNELHFVAEYVVEAY
jgi:hypothetical protein